MIEIIRFTFHCMLQSVLVIIDTCCFLVLYCAKRENLTMKFRNENYDKDNGRFERQGKFKSGYRVLSA